MSTGKWKRRRLIRESLRGDAFREWKSGGVYYVVELWWRIGRWSGEEACGSPN